MCVAGLTHSGAHLCYYLMQLGKAEGQNVTLTLLGVREEKKIWWDSINFASFGSPAYSTEQLVLASICVNCKTSQYRIVFLISTWQM